MRFVNVFVRLARKEHSHKRRVLGIVIGALVFLVMAPVLLIYVATIIDNMYSLKPIHEFIPCFRLYGIVLALILVALGLFFIGWAAYALWKHGRGSPLQIASTQKLVTIGPYAYCRNPIMLGSILYYLGLTLLIGSLIGIVLVILFEILYGIYIKLIEEKELELRFSREYKEYKKYIPFIVPRPKRKRSLQS